MNKKTKVGIIILTIVIIIAIIAIIIAFVNPFNNEETGAEALNDTEMNVETNNEELNTEAINNTETNNIENTEQEDNTITEEVNDDVIEEEPEQEASTSDNANNSNEEKAIELVRNEWGEDNSVYFDLAGVTSDGKYRVSVNKDTRVLAWYIVDIENETLTQM